MKLMQTFAQVLIKLIISKEILLVAGVTIATITIVKRVEKSGEFVDSEPESSLTAKQDKLLSKNAPSLQKNSIEQKVKLTRAPASKTSSEQLRERKDNFFNSNKNYYQNTPPTTNTPYVARGKASSEYYTPGSGPAPEPAKIPSQEKKVADDPINTPVSWSTTPELPVETDTSDFNEVGRSIASTTNRASLEQISCTSDLLAGIYGHQITIHITCNLAGYIKYCIKADGGCCDPNQSYAEQISLGTLDGNYCLSFSATAVDGQSSITTVETSYTIDSSLPSLMTNFPKTMLQTTETDLVVQTQSLDFGKLDHYFYQYNLKKHNPTSTGLGWSCEELITNATTLTSPTPLVLDENRDVSTLTASTQIDKNITLAGLSYGENYIATAIEDRGRSIASCDTKKVILQDFATFSFNGSEQHNFANGFTSYSHFQLTPSLIQQSGSFTNVRTSANLEGDFFTITN